MYRVENILSNINLAPPFSKVDKVVWISFFCNPIYTRGCKKIEMDSCGIPKAIHSHTKMEHIKSMQTRTGVDIGYHKDNMIPNGGEGVVGKSGIDKTFTLERVIGLAHKMEVRPNIIVKPGPNAKWYLKRFSPDTIEAEIEKQNWRNTSRCTMYIIEWN